MKLPETNSSPVEYRSAQAQFDGHLENGPASLYAHGSATPAYATSLGLSEELPMVCAFAFDISLPGLTVATCRRFMS